MKKIVLLIIIMIFDLSCGAKKTQSLKLTPSPKKPIYIPVGETTDCAGNKITAPFFQMTGMDVEWNGTGDLEIMALEIKTLGTTGSASGGSTTTYDCFAAGDVLRSIYLNNSVGARIIVVSGGKGSITCPFYCGGLPPPPNANSDTVNFPMQVKVTAAQLDSNHNSIARVTATAVITVQ